MTERAPVSERSIPWRSPVVQAVYLSTLLAPFSVALISPGLPVFQQTFETSQAATSLLLSAILLPGVFVSPLVGLLADQVGRRRVLVGSLLGWSLAGSLVVVRPPFAVVIGLRLLQGAALAGIGITTITLLSDMFEGVQRNEVLGVNTAVLSAGAAAFPLLGGALVAIAWTAPFAMYLLGLPVALFAARALEEPTGERPTRSLTYLQDAVGALPGSDAAVLYGSALLIDLLLFGAVFTALPFLLFESYGLSPVLIGLVVTTGEVASTVAATQNGRLSERLSDGAILAVGFAATGVGFVGVWLASSPLFVAIATLAYGAGWGLALPSIDAGISDLVPRQFRGGAVSLRNSASSAGRAAGPFAFASLGLVFGYETLLLAAGGVALGAAVTVGWLTT